MFKKYIIREGFILKKVKNDGIFHVQAWPPPPYDGKSFLNFFKALDHFLRTLWKIIHFALENANFGVEI